MKHTHVLLSISVLFMLVMLPGCTMPWSPEPPTDQELAAIVQQQEENSIYNQIERGTKILESANEEEQLRASLTQQIAQRVNSSYVYPIENYSKQKTKKVFGQYISPETSPIPNDTFTGYHAGDDIEVIDTNATVPVYALSAGTLVTKKTITGYGGVIIIEFTDPTTNLVLHALYGHIDLDSVALEVGAPVTAGQKLGELGADASEDTDGERKHLHFAIYQYNGADLYAGYVANQSDLNLWLNPSDFLSERSAAEPNQDSTNSNVEGEAINVSVDIDSVVGAALQQVE